MTRAAPPSAAVDLFPPHPPATVFRVLGVGVGLCGTAAAVGLADGIGPTALSPVRLALVAVGGLVAGCGLTLRPGDWRVYAAAALAAGLAVPGLPGHWDSARLLAGVLAAVAAAGAGLVAAPARWRAVALTAAVLFHFGALLTATTWPTTYASPPPWLTNQAALRLYLPYFKFMYLGNAYHFYSPDPGPASHLYFLIHYESDEEEVDEKTGKRAKKQVAEWVDMPKRRTQYRDPLGLTYYRRLSLTELVSYTTPGQASPPSVEKAVAVQRRRDNELGLNGRPVPGAVVGNEIDLSQYRVPHSYTRRYMLPSYARHVAHAYSGPRRTDDGRTVTYTVTRVKVFRVEHRVIEPQQFLEYDDPAASEMRRLNRGLDVAVTKYGKISPYHPALYSPFYLGEFDPAGRLVNPDDPLLYWLTPIAPVRAAADRPDFRDYMSEYARPAGGWHYADFVWPGKE